MPRSSPTSLPGRVTNGRAASTARRAAIIARAGTRRRASRGSGLTELDPYAVLGVPVHADADSIAAAYREQARRHHPDVSTAPDAERRMAEINAAWATLRDPVRRAAWDRANLRQPAASTGLGARPVPPSARRPGGAPPRPAPRPVRPSPPAPPAPAHVPAWRRGPNGEGAAGPPPGPRRGSVLPFGRHIGWSLGEVARVDPGYLAWLRDRREGAPYRAEIDRLLAALYQPGPRPAPPAPPGRRGRLRFR